MMGKEKFLVTGAMGCIGAWVVRNLICEGAEATIFDQSDNDHRLKLLLDTEALARVKYIQGSITNLDDIKNALRQSEATHIIHLAALQFPFCNADPGLGAQVNVVGTVNVFEAVRSAGNQVHGLSYASSIAAYGPDHLYPKKPLEEDIPLYPDTFYGTYKQTNENTARVFWKEAKIGSVGLRPATIYGVARDQGLTAGLSKATLAAALDQPFQINFDGPTALQYVDDTAYAWLALECLQHALALFISEQQYLMAVEVLSLILHHPDTMDITRARSARYEDALRADLSPEDFAAAWESGQQLDLGDLLTDLMEH